MADGFEFAITGKKNLTVYRSGASGTGNELRVVLAVARHRWKGIQLDITEHKAKWVDLPSKSLAQEWASFSRIVSDIYEAPGRIHRRAKSN